ncbi:TupA-like ATPgrasp [Lachnospiraceae bacterium]|nr:TupA-like ATPgrasp [Lachnospiraceae bacterium]
MAIDRKSWFRKQLAVWHESIVPPFLYPIALKNWFRKCTGRELDLKNPKTYCDKINWIKLYGVTPEMTRLSDKLLVRDFVAEKIGEQYLVPVLGSWDRFDDIDFDSLPKKFALKTNHGSATNIIVEDKEALDMKEAREKMNFWMSLNFAFEFGYQLQYRDIKRKIIAEEFIENSGNDLFDYKFHCFNGKPLYIEYIGGRKSSAREIYLDTEWNPVDFYDAVFPRYEKVPEKPVCLEKLVELASTLSEGWNYVRVDFYVLDNGDIKFGEMTFTPGSGQYTWNPPEADLFMGEKIELPI